MPSFKVHFKSNDNGYDRKDIVGTHADIRPVDGSLVVWEGDEARVRFNSWCWAFVERIED